MEVFPCDRLVCCERFPLKPALVICFYPIIDINYPDLANAAKFNQTPIQCATVGGHLDVVKLLINKGAKLDRDFGSIPMAVTLDRHEIFVALVRAGAPIGNALSASPSLPPFPIPSLSP